MNVQEVMTNVLQTSAAVEIMNELVVATLASSREMLVLERKRLDKIEESRGLYLHEEEDWEALVQDIVALDRVIDYYGG
jgi:hypothetical protein